MGPPIRQSPQFGEKACKDAIKVFADFLIREPDSRVAAQAIRPITHIIALWIMRIAVHLHNQSFLRTEEIDDAIADDVLATKLIAAKLRTTEMAP